MPDAVYLAFLLVDGALAGAIYALVALAFVVVYKMSAVLVRRREFGSRARRS